MTAIFQKYADALERMDPIKQIGTVRKVKGLLVESHGPQVVVGELCQILTCDGEVPVWAEVVGFRDRVVQLMPFEAMDGIEPGSPVIAMGEPLSVPVSDAMLGRVLDAMGKPMDGKGPIGSAETVSIVNEPPDVLTRKTIRDQMVTGVRCLDTMTPIGKGQRIGIFSGSGVGKSTLLGMIARNTSADINVIALIGERGREVQEFIEYDLGPEGLARSVLVVSTGDTSPLSRLRGAFVATSIAEYFRDKGSDVMLLFDSVTRFARAQREIGLAVGEPPATRGYTPSVFSTLPKLLERCGSGEVGTVTGFYTILVEGDDMDEPIADAVRGILDGHIVLSRRQAQANRYPAVDVLASLSRLGTKITSPSVQKAAGKIRSLLAVYTDAEDLINVGAYARGSNAAIDEAMDKIDEIRGFFSQGITESASILETVKRMAEIAGVPVPEEELEGYEALQV
jgi:flagellum-specific ATP synthase